LVLKDRDSTVKYFSANCCCYLAIKNRRY